MKVKAVGQFLLCEDFEPEFESKGGLALPPSCRQSGEYPSKFGKVLHKGKDVKLYKVGDKVIYAGQQGHFVRLGADKYRIVREDDIVGVLLDE